MRSPARLGRAPIQVDAERVRTIVPGEWQLIDETVLTGTATSVTFSSIPGRYRTLKLLCQARTDRAVTAEGLFGRFNGDTGTNYHRMFGYFRADGTQGSGGAFNQTGFYAGTAYGSTALANTFCSTEIEINGYALSDRCKHVAARVMPRIMAAAAASADIVFYGNLWLNTNAVTSIVLFPDVGPNFVSGSRFTLYGIF